MAVKFKSISAKVSALALAIGTLGLPGAAFAQDEGPQGRSEEAPIRAETTVSSPAPQQRSWSRPARADVPRAEPAPAAAAAPAYTPRVYTQGEAAPAAAPGGWDRGGRAGWQGRRDGERRGDGDRRSDGDRRADGDRRGDGNGWGGWNRSGQTQGQATVTPPVAQPAPAPSRPTTQGRSWDDRSRDGWRNDERRAWARGEHLRDGDRDRRDGDRWRRDGDRARDGDRSRSDRNGWSHDRNSWGHDGNRNRYGSDHRRWDNRWRDNRRYDWYSYRRTNPNIFRHSYYAPYRNYRYQRLSVGFFLDSLFFGSRYWINDPWQYRLPDVYGPYRWVRYYDDALLVNIHTGEVVDVINHFFW